MSIYGALYSSVAGIQAQGNAIGIISDNVSNISTIGYKAGSSYFSTLVTDSGSTASYSPGGVRASNRQLVSQQGLLQTTNSPTDIAVSGGGMFVVSSGPDGVNGTNQVLYTRAGSFKTDALGNFVNANGGYLLAWPLDASGNLPGQSTNTAGGKLFTNLDSLQVVNVGSAFGSASSTTKVSVGANLDSTAASYPGALGNAKPGSVALVTENAGLQSSQILIPNANIALGDQLTATVPISGVSTSYNFVYGGVGISNDIAGGILGATNTTSTFTSAADQDKFNITLDGKDYTFTYTTGVGTPSAGTFTNPLELADAISAVKGLTARVTTNAGGNINLYVSAEDARKAITFTNVTGSFVGTAGTNLFETDDASMVSAATSTTALRWNTLDGLAKLVDQQAVGISSNVKNGTTSNASLDIFNDDPQTTITFSDTAAAGAGKFLQELGLPATAVAATYVPSKGGTKSMASGNVTPSFIRGVTVYDTQGTGHTLNIGFLKVGDNKWSVEIYSADASDIVNVPADEKLLIAGTVEFNGNGTIKNISSSLTDPLTISWANKSDSSSISFNFGDVDKNNGLRQYASSSNLAFLTQNGSSVGLLDSVNIDSNGFVIANFNNGQSQKLYKIPLAAFKNPDGLVRKANNAFLQSIDSGEVNLKQVGEGDVGKISASSLESANAELSKELTDMIVAQRAYQASAKVISTANQLLDDLNRIGG